jgi:hypothetical protein
MDLVRMVSSGTEATMSAIRLARGFTGRDKLVKFEGCYHGHSDSLLVKAGSGALTLGEPSSPGVPAALAELTVTLTYNDLDQVRDTFARIGGDIACIIVEPVAGNMNCIPPVPGFLDGLREVCDQHGAVLIFDEVMTGFRVALGGAQAVYGVVPDLTTLGKVIGGGMPVGAFGGRRDIMERIAPKAGTSWNALGNPVSLAADWRRSGNFTSRLSRNSRRKHQGSHGGWKRPACGALATSLSVLAFLHPGTGRDARAGHGLRRRALQNSFTDTRRVYSCRPRLRPACLGASDADIAATLTRRRRFSRLIKNGPVVRPCAPHINLRQLTRIFSEANLTVATADGSPRR